MAHSTCARVAAKIGATQEVPRMTPPAITLETFAPCHLEEAAALSRAAGWPHRTEDWALTLRVSQGVVAVAEGRVVGTALATPYGRAGTLNMIIVAEDMRGRGLGRSLMTRAMTLASPTEWRLVATRDGLPLYRKLGFVETGGVAQHQGVYQPEPAAAPGDGPAWAGAAETDAVAALDFVATGMDRAALIAALAEVGRIAVLREGARIIGYGALRSFGRGEVAGPVIARDAADARRLLAFLLAERQGRFVRVDTQDDGALAPWLVARGLEPVGGGVAMRRGAAPTATNFRSFALAAQALG